MRPICSMLALAAAVLSLSACGTAKRALGVPVRLIQSGARTVTENDTTSPQSRPGFEGEAALATRIYGP